MGPIHRPPGECLNTLRARCGHKAEWGASLRLRGEEDVEHRGAESRGLWDTGMHDVRCGLTLSSELAGGRGSQSQAVSGGVESINS